MTMSNITEDDNNVSFGSPSSTSSMRGFALRDNRSKARREPKAVSRTLTKEPKSY